ncbi:anti-sigma factor family protein [Oribacterium sp. HCP28S3_H8]|jgi:hypothetical protein|uniref:anti-sigma factor family protein n=1 Tax=Oribacterium sp. HCP28S3_H8 TaxID=3438945 RepID=UPI0030284F8F|nr:zf-HC2 domain-containing protein [Oribacterium sp.]
MTCLEARKCIFNYLNHNLDDETLKKFMEHLEECPDCMEELRITHMVYSGVARLDSENDEDSMDLDSEFRHTLEQSRFHLMKVAAVRICRYAVDTMVFWETMIILFMQLRVWLLGY